MVGPEGKCQKGADFQKGLEKPPLVELRAEVLIKVFGWANLFKNAIRRVTPFIPPKIRKPQKASEGTLLIPF